ncbi:hypothetical protein [Streptomyces sp. MB09-02B]|uniref:hypothetical protein n=1 Tax=Streptomyces sp. MB09-02B TaxID=3028667 RepID=UPI0029BBE726|nr:hypothetical protein [Streptomyces sp. MB09-02B]MDX3645494.1 hypothetical protein [Streptomyces sp. MB09-02B]
MIKRITLRTRKRKTARASAAVTLFVVILAIAFLQFPLATTKAAAASSDCPGSSSSGTGDHENCSNLHNRDLRDQRKFPDELFRGDSRLPYTVFNTGFFARGGNNNLVAHVQGDRAGNSNYISTTGTLGVALPFAQSQGMRNLESAARLRCQQVQAVNNARRGWISRLFPSNCNGTQTVSADTYVYVINPRLARNALYVPDQIRGNANLYNHYASQDEWAFVHTIPREAIEGARVYRMTARTNNGLIDTRSISIRFQHTVMNPNYNQVTINYNPNNDANSHFVYSSNLNIPPSTANPYVRGCSSITRCRGGGN